MNLTAGNDRKTLLEGLGQGADIWWLRPDMVTDAQQEKCRASLSAEETTRYQRFRFADDRLHYLVAHGMLRCVLSSYANVEPAAWEFVQGTHGRPEIAAPVCEPGLRFNLSHTPGLVACVISDDAACGVDVEALTMRRHALGIAERMFADNELARLKSLDGLAFLRMFFTLWTLREAWCKARGTGLAGSGRDFYFPCSDADGWQIRFSDDRQFDGEWQMDVHPIGDTHILSVAVDVADGKSSALDYREFRF